MKTNLKTQVLHAAVLVLTCQWGDVFSQSQWRALIVYTNAVDSTEGQINMYEDKFLGVFDEINLIYETSEMETRAQIAGVIHDTSYVGVGAKASLDRLVNASDGMGKYVNLLEKYSADVLILRDVEPTPSDTGGITWLLNTWTSLGYAAFWVDSDNAVDWAHEVGHIHNANHCHGYRQTFDSLGAFVSEIESHQIPACQQSINPPSSGFNTIMSYGVGNSCYGYGIGQVCPTPACYGFYDGGRLGFSTYPTMTFSNPDITWLHPGTQTVFRLGVDTSFIVNNNPVCNLPAQTTMHIQRNVAGLHSQNMTAVNGLKESPDTLLIGDALSLKFGEYANFIANSSVRVASGFRIMAGSSMRITVGEQQTLSKKATKSIPDSGLGQARTGFGLENIRLDYNSMTETLLISFMSSELKRVTLSVYDARGVRVRPMEVFVVGPGENSKKLHLAGLPKGAFVISGKIGNRDFHKRIVKI